MRISIIVPIYNVEKYLDRCIQSLINQTYPNIEIILVNDGSLDNSLSICEKYAKQDKRIKILNKINGGLSDARNAGLEISTGEYVLFVDSDDYIELESCKQFVDVLQNEKSVDILSGNAKVIKDTKISYMNRSGNYNHSISGKEFLKNELKQDTMYMAAWLNLYKRDFLIENNLLFKKGLLHEDEDFTPRAFLIAKKVINVQFNFYNYIIRENSISTQKDMSKNAEHLFSTLYSLETIYDQLEDDELRQLLKNSLTEKYLNMCQLLNNTKSSYDKGLEKDFVLRNAYSSRNMKKAKLFRLNSKLYFIVNNITKNVNADLKEIFDRNNIIYTFFIFLGVIFLSRFFSLYVDFSANTTSMYIFLSRLITFFSICLYLKLLIKKNISIYNILLLLFYIVVFLLNIFNHGNLRGVLSITYPIIALSIILEMSFKHNYKSAIISLNYIFSILIFINFFQMLFLHNVLGEHIYFLGPRNQLGPVFLISIFICYLYSRIRNNSYIFNIILLITLLSIVMAGSINNLIAYLFLIFYLILEKKQHHLFKYFDNLSMFKISISYIIFSISVIILRIQNIFSFLIEDVFHRSLSLSGRTFIWDQALKKIIDQPFLGYGKGVSGNYFTVKYIMSNDIEKVATYSAHNTFLQSAYESGIIPIILFFTFIMYVGKYIKEKKLEEMKIFHVIVFSLLIIMMMEAIGFDAVFFIFSIAFFYCSNKTEREDL